MDNSRKSFSRHSQFAANHSRTQTQSLLENFKAVIFRVPVFYFDRWLLIGALPLIILGFLMVASASMVISDRQFGTPFHYLFRQGVYLLIGMGLAVVILQVPINFWRRMSGYLLLFSIICLAVVLIPGIGREVNGSSRWISFGFFSISGL